MTYKTEVTSSTPTTNVLFFYEKEFKFKGYYKVVVVYLHKRACLPNYNVTKHVLGETPKFFANPLLPRF